jgi:hypothetical protein
MFQTELRMPIHTYHTCLVCIQESKDNGHIDAWLVARNPLTPPRICNIEALRYRCHCGILLIRDTASIIFSDKLVTTCLFPYMYCMMQFHPLP